jgi:hypothetical protein
LTRPRSQWAELAPNWLRGLRRLAERPRVKKGARVVLVATGGLYLFYLIVTNAILRFGGVEWFVNSSTDDAHLTLGPSHTWFPGRIEVRDLKLRFEDVNVQFELVVARASAELDFFSLARKRLHLHALEADGVRFLLRHKVTSVAGNEKRLLHFPRIDGFSDPPILIPEPKSDKTKNWALILENVHAHGVELWFMEYRCTGRAEVAGAFELFPGRKLRVGPAHMDFVSGELSIGKKRPMAHAVRGSLDFRFRETNPDPIPGLEIFRQISAKAVLDAELVDLEAANLYVPDAVAVRRGAGHLSARIELVDGRFVPESRVSVLSAEDTHVVLPDAALAGRFDVEFLARAENAGPARLVVDASLASVDATLGDARTSEPGDVSVQSVKAVVVTDHADVARPWKLEEASFRVVDGRVPDLRRLEGSSKERMLESGSAWFLAHAELVRNGKWSGALRADARRVGVRVGERRTVLDASLSAAAESERRDLESGVIRDVELEVESLDPPRGEQPLRVSARIPRTEWTGFPPDTAKGRATLTAQRIEPVFQALDAPGILVSLWPDAPLEASARFVFDDDALDVRLDLAKSGPFRAMGRLRVCSPPKGAFLVKSGAFSVGLAVRGGSVRVVPLAGDEWLAKNAPVCPSVE